MNKLKLYTIAAVGLALTSCNDFLDTEPASGFGVDEVFASDTEMKSLVTQLYSQLTTDGLYGSTLVYGLNTNTDVEMSSFSNNTVSAQGSDVGCFDAQPTWTTLNSTWNNIYNCINNANDFIQNCEQRSGFTTTVSADGPTNAQQMYGEAKCIRAMLYLDLIRTWGDVVFTTRATTAADDFFNVGTTDRNVILDSLISELRVVEPMMKYASDIDEGVERCGREYCQALIGQLALYRGGYSLRADAQHATGVMKRADDYLTYYNIAIDYLARVISDGHHALSLSFHDFWNNECNWKVVNNDDAIFEVPMLKNVTSRYGYHIGVRIEAGDHQYGSARNYCTLSGTYIYSFDKRDLRRDETVAPYRYDKNLNQVIDMGITGFGCAKWSKLKMTSPLGSNSAGNTGINSVRMRYADVLLMYAEAINEVNGPTDAAKAALKQVRRRAFQSGDWAEMVDAYVDALGTKDDFFRAIMNERKWEFGGEGVRKYDLARWNKYGEVIYDLYHQYQNWALAANGRYVVGLDSVPAQVYYKSVEDADNPGRTKLDIVGIDQYGDGVFRPAGYSTLDYAAGWYVLNKETQQFEIADAISWSFRGFINEGNEGSVQRTDAVRYLMPYPSKVITDHRGKITQQYGY